MFIRVNLRNPRLMRNAEQSQTPAYGRKLQASPHAGQDRRTGNQNSRGRVIRIAGNREENSSGISNIEQGTSNVEVFLRASVPVDPRVKKQSQTASRSNVRTARGAWSPKSWKQRRSNSTESCVLGRSSRIRRRQTMRTPCLPPRQPAHSVRGPEGKSKVQKAKENNKAWEGERRG